MVLNAASGARMFFISPLLSVKRKTGSMPMVVPALGSVAISGTGNRLKGHWLGCQIGDVQESGSFQSAGSKKLAPAFPASNENATIRASTLNNPRIGT